MIAWKKLFCAALAFATLAGNANAVIIARKSSSAGWLNAHSTTVIASNTNETSAGYVTISAGNNSSVRYAQAFTVGDTSLGLSKVVLNLGSESGDQDIDLYLYAADANGNPGTLLTTFSSCNEYQSYYYFLLDTAVTLDADTTYLLVLVENTSGSSIAWNYSDSTSTGTSYTTIPSTNTRLYSTDGGTSWTGEDGDALYFALLGAVVPEPAECAAALGIAAFIVAAFVRRGR